MERNFGGVNRWINPDRKFGGEIRRTWREEVFKWVDYGLAFINNLDGVSWQGIAKEAFSVVRFVVEQGSPARAEWLERRKGWPLTWRCLPSPGGPCTETQQAVVTSNVFEH